MTKKSKITKLLNNTSVVAQIAKQIKDRSGRKVYHFYFNDNEYTQEFVVTVDDEADTLDAEYRLNNLQTQLNRQIDSFVKYVNMLTSLAQVTANQAMTELQYTMTDETLPIYEAQHEVFLKLKRI